MVRYVRECTSAFLSDGTIVKVVEALEAFLRRLPEGDMGEATTGGGNRCDMQGDGGQGGGNHRGRQQVGRGAPGGGSNRSAYLIICCFSIILCRFFIICSFCFIMCHFFTIICSFLILFVIFICWH